MLVSNYSRYAKAFRVVPGPSRLKKGLFMDKDEFIQLYNELSEEDKELIKDLLLEQEQRP